MSITEESWKYAINLSEIEEKRFIDFELHINEHCNQILKLLEESFLQGIIYQVNTGQSYDEELRLLVEKNKKLRQEVEDKLKTVSRQQTQYENYKQDQKLLSQEVKETHEAFLMAKKYYKKFLKMYYCIESRTDDKQVIYIQFFTEAKKDTENYSVRLIRNLKSKQYELLSTTPKLKMLKEYQRILQETEDVPGALCTIRDEFVTIKGAKK
ncbi:uncharacterized protein [Epargyreus clarus]|uniref:uncharacterized protein n=1 Tax=Epargyreus clarus TaxID=520877 RepID=UPI003C308218